MPLMPRRAAVALAAALSTLCLLPAAALANEAVIRKNIAERMPDFPKIDEVSKTSVQGLWELRIGNDVVYTDAEGQHLIQGAIFDTKTRTNLTEQRLDKLTAIDVSALPLKDAITWKQGSGARKLVVFEDPNCGYCKKFERDLSLVKDVTVHLFLYPILGPDSTAKSRDIWCAADRAKTWRDWMLNNTAPPKTMGQCDVAALQRNLELGKKHRVNGTPALVFEDGKRVPGAIAIDQIEKQLVASKSKG
jgi:thiol:disulfide interchange protein DsbC